MNKLAWMTVGVLGLTCSVWAQTNTTTPESLAEPPLWPLAYKLPESMIEHKATKGPPKADLKVWVPEGAKHIRAMLLIPENSDSKHFGEHAPLRAIATKHEMAILYVRSYNTGVEGQGIPSDPTRMQKLLDYMVEQTGIKEFRYAPWITFGKSSRGQFPFHMAWLFPERTIASVTYHGETPSWPVADWAKLNGETILQVNANGETEWGGTWYNHVRPALLNYRAQKGWMSHQVVARYVGHGDYPDAHGSPGWGLKFPKKVTCIDVWDYLALFIDKALDLRLPKDHYPTNHPLTLKTVDEAGGYLIDPYAVEESFGVPHLPLREGPGGFLLADTNDAPVDGFAAMAPLKDFRAPDGVPVVKLETGKSPTQWLLSDSLKFPMEADPMLELGPLQKLMPRIGDEVTIDGKTLTFQPILPKQIATHGGIALNTGLRPPNSKITMLAYTVLDVPEKKIVKVTANYTAATRVQLVLNGIPVKHKQVLELQPGKYPLLMVVRMTTNWNVLEPSLNEISEGDIVLAKQMQDESDKLASVKPLKRDLIRKASEVPAAERKKMFWIADKELADAWLTLHSSRK